MEIDYDYLRTGTAIGFCASHELCSNYLFNANHLLHYDQLKACTSRTN